MSIHRTLTPLTLVLALVSLLAAACGGGGAGDAVAELSPEEAVAAAATNTADAGTYRADFTITMSGLGAEPLTMTGEGEFDAERQVGRMTFDMSGLGGAGGPDLGKAEVIFEGLVVYMKLPFLQEVRPGIEPWIRFDFEELGKQQGIDLGGLQQLNQGDPSQVLAYLKASSDDVKKAGAEEIRGVQTTHYTMTVDLHKVAEQVPEQKANVERVIEQSGVETVPTEVWIDDEGRARRMELRYDDMLFAPGQRGNMEMTMDLFDFGVEVDVEPPPASQVTDISELLQQPPA